MSFEFVVQARIRDPNVPERSDAGIVGDGRRRRPAPRSRVSSRSTTPLDDCSRRRPVSPVSRLPAQVLVPGTGENPNGG